MKENYGRLSLVKNDGKDILISGTNLSSAGFGATQFISQASVSLRESKGRFDANIADAMGFGSVNKGVMLGGFSSVRTGLGALAEEINKSADQTGVRATFTVETRGIAAVRAGTTSDDFAINGVTIGQVAYEDGDSNGALVSAINSVKDTTGVEASIDANGQLLLTSREGRGIKIDGNIGGGAFINTWSLSR